MRTADVRVQRVESGAERQRREGVERVTRADRAERGALELAATRLEALAPSHSGEIWPIYDG